jgi:hypothetical protein
MSLINIIERVEKDRINRLDLVAEGYSKANNMTKVDEALRLASQLASSLEGINRDKILASVIQTAHELNKEIGDWLVKLIKKLRFKNLARTQVTVTAPFIFTL